MSVALARGSVENQSSPKVEGLILILAEAKSCLFGGLGLHVSMKKKKKKMRKKRRKTTRKTF